MHRHKVAGHVGVKPRHWEADPLAVALLLTAFGYPNTVPVPARDALAIDMTMA